MKNKEKFKDELIELLYKYDLSVGNFLEEVNEDMFWVDKISNKKLKKLLDKSVEL